MKKTPVMVPDHLLERLDGLAAWLNDGPNGLKMYVGEGGKEGMREWALRTLLGGALEANGVPIWVREDTRPHGAEES